MPACFISSFLPTAPSPSDALGGVLGLVAPSQNCRQGTLNALSEAASKGWQVEGAIQAVVKHQTLKRKKLQSFKAYSD